MFTIFGYSSARLFAQLVLGLINGVDRAWQRDAVAERARSGRNFCASGGAVFVAYVLGIEVQMNAESRRAGLA